MHIWILKYSDKSFTANFIDTADKIAEGIDQLKFRDILQKSLGKFHFISITTKIERCQKKYLSDNDKSISGYSGLLIGKTTIDDDLRDVRNLEINNPSKYNGQFAFFRFNEESFECWGDNFGFHKVFYGEVDGEIYVSNSIELLKKVDGIQPNIEKMINDFITVKFGVYFGYSTVLKDFKTLPEYGKLKIENNLLHVSTYRELNELLNPNDTFENKLTQTINEFRTAGQYLRKYHSSVIPLSGGFDGRTILSFFYKTEGKSLETMTYNRAWNLDFMIAKRLSKLFGVPHKKINISNSIHDFEVKIPEYKSIKDDPFYKGFYLALKDFYNAGDSFKVSLGGNGADTDWVSGERFIKKLDKSNFKTFVSSYSKILSQSSEVKPEVSQNIAKDIEKYLMDKYRIFETKTNFVQLLSSAFFHLERFRSEQGIIYSQYFNEKHDVFLPYASESFNQTVFLASKKQLDRGLREGINYKIYYALTEGTTPYAPILTAKNEHAKNWFQGQINNISPLVQKVIWKLRNGDTNYKLREKYDFRINKLSKSYLKSSRNNPILEYLDYEKLSELVQSDDYSSRLNEVAKMLKFVDDLKTKS